MRHARRGWFLASVFAAVVWGTGAPPAGATVVVPITVADLTRRADDVVVGEVRRASSQWDGGFIVTDYEVEVATTLKGTALPRSTVLVRLPGGVVGTIGQTVPGVSALAVGQTYVLFLNVGASGLRYLAHLTAAVLPVQLDPATGDLRALPQHGLVAAGTPVPALSLPSLAVQVHVAQETAPGAPDGPRPAP